MYGRFDFRLKREAFYDSNINPDDPYNALPNVNLTTQNLSKCESNTGLSGASRNLTQKHSGTYSWRASNQTNPAIAYTFSAIDISSFFKKGYLRLYVYCANISRKGHTMTVELTSSGACDNQEIFFDVSNQIKATGWNEIIVELSACSKGSTTEFDKTSLNYFRFYVLDSNCYYYVDDIDLLYESEPNNVLTLNECENLTGSGAVSLSDFSMCGEHSWMTNETSETTFVYSFSAINISSYMSSGYIQFYFYCPDLDLLGSQMFIELTSSGIWDNEEITARLDLNYVTRDGWNEIKVPLSSMVAGSSTTFDPTRCNFMRIFTLGSNCHFYLDHIQFL